MKDLGQFLELLHVKNVKYLNRYAHVQGMQLFCQSEGSDWVGPWQTLRLERIAGRLQGKRFFVELPPFQKRRADYPTDDSYRQLQHALMENPTAGPMIQGTGGLRKLRWPDVVRNKGKRGGIRVIYYDWIEGGQFWLFTLYEKDELSDLDAQQKKAVRARPEAELAARTR